MNDDHRRRQYLDRADDAPAISWGVRVEVVVHGAPGCVAEPYGEALRRRLPRLRRRRRAESQQRSAPHRTAPRRLDASTHRQAEATARALCAPAIEEALHAATSERGQIVDGWQVNAYPTDSRQALKARLRGEGAPAGTSWGAGRARSSQAAGSDIPVNMRSLWLDAAFRSLDFQSR